jgi:hypothetical protein
MLMPQGRRPPGPVLAVSSDVCGFFFLIGRDWTEIADSFKKIRDVLVCGAHNTTQALLGTDV